MKKFSRNQQIVNKLTIPPDPIIEIRENPKAIVEYLKTDTQKKVFNVILSLYYRYADIYISLESIAIEADCSVTSVKRCMKLFSELGLVETQYRHRKTSLYYVSPFFRLNWVKKELRFIFHACQKFAVIVLISLLSKKDDRINVLENGLPSYYFNDLKYNNYNNLSNIPRESIARACVEKLPPPPVVYGDYESPFSLKPQRVRMGYEDIAEQLKALNVPHSDIIILCSYPRKAVKYAIKSLKGNAKNIYNIGKYLLGIVKNYEAREEGKKQPKIIFAPIAPKTIKRKKLKRAIFKPVTIDQNVESEHFNLKKHQSPQIIALEEKLKKEISWQDIATNPFKYLSEIIKIQTKMGQF